LLGNLVAVASEVCHSVSPCHPRVILYGWAPDHIVVVYLGCRHSGLG
jgi:hypothetical protein